MAALRPWVYYFGNGKAEGTGAQKELLGGKGAGLAEMTRIGLPVPGGFTITTKACAEYHNSGKWPQGLEKQVRQALARLERSCKKKLGGARDPLLVSVRSGAARSMPGMMETVLNLGLTDRSVEGLAKASSNRRFAFDAYRRLIMMYGSVVKGIDRRLFEQAFDEVKENLTRPRIGCEPDRRILDTEVNAEELEHLVGEFKRIYQEHSGEPFPQNAFEQLKGAINAVFASWMADKAVTYRRVENITGLDGTAVNVCRMVFGNLGEDSGTGVCFTRDPNTGDPTLFGEVLINAQGEDVVAGARTPLKLSELKARMPEVYEQLEAVRIILEVHYRDMQDLEFTVERGKLFMLQCRVGKRSPVAAFKIAVDQATKGLMSPAAAARFVKKGYFSRKCAAAATKPVISKDEAIQRIQPADVERLFFPVLNPDLSSEELVSRRLGRGIGAVPGAACGEIVFTAEEAEARAKGGTAVILVRKETSPEDIGGMYAASGILTATGGKTSHAAVVARGWGKCCVVGCEALSIDYDRKFMMLNGRTLREGDPITLDGRDGQILEGRIDLVRPDAPPEYYTLMQWVDKRRRLGVRCNADTPADAAKAVELGAEGVGLCRTEHMFFDPSQPQRMNAMREMILAENLDDRRRALDKLLPFQREDFEGIFTIMNGRPVTIRLLDPPLHEFLPHHDNPGGQQSVANELNSSVRAEALHRPPEDYESRRALEARYVTIEDIRRRVDQLRESNPMLGHRGCRLAITFPEILEMQVRAIMEAAVACVQKGISVVPEIMIPLSIDPKELSILTARTRSVADAILKEHNTKVSYRVGTMVETPRAALLAGRLAEVADFFSFGTNDLTQLTLALSRDDAGRFLPYYLSEPRALARADTSGREEVRASTGAELPDELKSPILPHDPFQSLDLEGVGLLIQMAVENGRAARPGIKLGICGVHAADPDSIRFCEQIRLDYVSCSTFHVPIARLAAAQAVINAPKLGPRIVKANTKLRSVVRPTKAAAPVPKRRKPQAKNNRSPRTRRPAKA